MITTDNFKEVLQWMGFAESEPHVYVKGFGNQLETQMVADFRTQQLTYAHGIDTGDNTTTTFKRKADGKMPNENFVVFLTVCQLLKKGYKPTDIRLEQKWGLGLDGKGGKADITVRKNGVVYLIIECKTAGKAFNEARRRLFHFDPLRDDTSSQLFSYWAQARSAQWLSLYALDFDAQKQKLVEQEETIRSHDDKNILLTAEQNKDDVTKLYKNASEMKHAFEVWSETYAKKTYHGLIFGPEAQAYHIGIIPIRKGRLKPFVQLEDAGSKFMEILYRNNISDKENAFNKLLSLFICKLVDERKKNDGDLVDFQYKEYEDDYYSLYERLLALFQTGMEEFLHEEVYNTDNDYIHRTLQLYTGKNRKELEAELNRTLQKTKMLSCQVFAFREVYNERLFFENGKILVEMVQLFQEYKLAYSSKEQFLGNMFEYLLCQGFKQDEGQFFTPIPITRFIWNSLPFERFVNIEHRTFPRVIDYACGSGHFLTEGIAAIKDYCAQEGCTDITDSEISQTFYGTDKDNRLARVSKVAMLLNGADNAHINAGDGLEHNEFIHGDLHSFDILVANPPYSVKGFKQNESKEVLHNYETIKLMTASSKEIQDVFVERAEHLLRTAKDRPGICAIVVNSSVLNNTEEWDKKVRELMLQHFYIRAIVSLGSQTFAQAGVSVVILFLEHRPEPPQQARQLKDSVEAILDGDVLTDWQDKEIYESYLQHIGVSEEEWWKFLSSDLIYESDISDYCRLFNQAFWQDRKILELTHRIEEMRKGKIKYAKTEVEYEEEIRLMYIDMLREIEREKILYFALTYQQTTLLVNAPTDTKSQKDFLGYYFKTDKKQQVLVEQDGLLSDVKNRKNPEKIAYVIKSFMQGISLPLAPKLAKFVSYQQTSDLLDLNSAIFCKTLTTRGGELNEKKISSAWYKYENIKIGEMFVISSGGTPSRRNPEYWNNGNIPWVKTAELQDSIILSTEEQITEEGLRNSSARIYDEGSLIVAMYGATIGQTGKLGIKAATNQACAVLSKKKINVETDYVWLLLRELKEELKSLGHGGAQSNLNAGDVANFMIPYPDIDVQKDIVSECMVIEDEMKKAQEDIVKNRSLEENIIANVSGEKKQLNVIAPFASDKINFVDIIASDYITTDNLLQDFGGVRPYDGAPQKGSVIKYQRGDILMSNIRPYLRKLWLADRDGGCNPDVLVFRPTAAVLPEFAYYMLRRQAFIDHVMSDVKGAKMPRGNKTNTLRYTIPVPPIEVQRQTVADIAALEVRIVEAKSILASSDERKRQILDKYLR